MRTLFIFLTFALSTAQAAELDAQQKAALADTQNLLNNQARLSEFTKGNPDAANALNQFKQLTGGDPQKQAQLQKLSSDIFTNITKQTGGNDAAIMQKLQEGLRNPASFMQSLTPEQQAQLKAMAAEIDKKQ